MRRAPPEPSYHDQVLTSRRRLGCVHGSGSTGGPMGTRRDTGSGLAPSPMGRVRAARVASGPHGSLSEVASVGTVQEFNLLVGHGSVPGRTESFHLFPFLGGNLVWSRRGGTTILRVCCLTFDGTGLTSLTGSAILLSRRVYPPDRSFHIWVLGVELGYVCCMLTFDSWTYNEAVLVDVSSLSHTLIITHVHRNSH